MLDKRPLKTPAKADLALPTQALAAAIAQEWQGQGDRLDIANMHLMRLANVAIDRTPPARAEMADELTRYCETDCICHLTDGPSALLEREEAGWRPVRNWAGQELDIMLLPVQGIIAAPQPKASLAAARAHALSLDDFRLTGLVYACGLFGSALLALAVEQRRLSALEAFDLSRIDEVWQIEQWGEDEEAADMANAKRREADTVNAWFGALTL